MYLDMFLADGEQMHTDSTQIFSCPVRIVICHVVALISASASNHVSN